MQTLTLAEVLQHWAEPPLQVRTPTRQLRTLRPRMPPATGVQQATVLPALHWDDEPPWPLRATTSAGAAATVMAMAAAERMLVSCILDGWG